MEAVVADTVGLLTAFIVGMAFTAALFVIIWIFRAGVWWKRGYSIGYDRAREDFASRQRQG